ncbi:ribosome biogenesis factor YjgA [Thermomonas flagellata]|uniref:ribosome biogenesis factor YjgA n=1 Tax=Thermomonas flagellata TaxID=2888524 RepID=UPI001F048AB2|nr:ribosome biogenesis factor YjgA [Thermomonas flagellata]
MRGRDPDTGEYLGPSRSQQRRAALDVLELGQQLAALSAAQLARLPLPEELLPHIREAQRITAHIARKRQLAFLAKQMRALEAETLEAIRAALAQDGADARRATARMHRAEALREALLGDAGDAALAALLAAHPQADHQQLRQLVRNARAERTHGKPPRAQRALYRQLHALLDDPAPHAHAASAETMDDGPHA